MDDLGFWEKVLIYGMLGVLPWIFVAAGGWLLWSAHKFMGRAVKAKGTVLTVSRHVSTRTSNGGSRRSVTYKPTFEYTDPAGQTRRAETFLSSSGYNFEIGSQHEILIDPNGGSVRMPGFWVYGFGALFAVIGLAFAIAGIFALAAM